MQVYKLFLRIVNKHKISLLLTVVIGMILSVVFLTSSSNTEKIEKANIVIIDKDQSEASKDLTKYLKEVSNVNNVDEDKVEDELYYRHIEYVLYIPKGYEEDILNKKEVTLDKKQVPDSVSAYMVDQYVASYTDTAYTYAKYTDGNIASILKKTNENLNVQVDMNNVAKAEVPRVSGFFDFMSYSFLSSLLWTIGTVMVELNKTDIKRRMAVSPISSSSQSMQLVSAAITVGVFLVALASIFAYGMFSAGMVTPGAYLYVVNLIVYLVPSLSIAYLLGTFIKKIEVLSGIANILCLAFAFLGGAFVPQSMLSESVKAIGRFTPSYWFVDANQQIKDLTSVSFEKIQPILQSMGIQIAYGVVVLIIAVIISKKLKKNIV